MELLKKILALSLAAVMSIGSLSAVINPAKYDVKNGEVIYVSTGKKAPKKLAAEYLQWLSHQNHDDASTDNSDSDEEEHVNVTEITEEENQVFVLDLKAQEKKALDNWDNADALLEMGKELRHSSDAQELLERISARAHELMSNSSAQIIQDAEKLENTAIKSEIDDTWFESLFESSINDSAIIVNDSVNNIQNVVIDPVQKKPFVIKVTNKTGKQNLPVAQEFDVVVDPVQKKPFVIKLTDKPGNQNLPITQEFDVVIDPVQKKPFVIKLTDKPGKQNLTSEEFDVVIDGVQLTNVVVKNAPVVAPVNQNFATILYNLATLRNAGRAVGAVVAAMLGDSMLNQHGDFQTYLLGLGEIALSISPDIYDALKALYVYLFAQDAQQEN